MTTTTLPLGEVRLNLLPFDASSKVVADWLTQWLGNWQKEAGLWLLLEQMHHFDFVGPDVDDIRHLVTEDALGTYGLRGRLFWETGQIQWRRLSPQTLRVVAMSEETNAISSPDNVEPMEETLVMAMCDGRLILWGTSRDKEGGGKEFIERRVAGSVSIEYPPFIEAIASGIKGVSYPVLPFRTYFNDEGREQFRRFLPPIVCDGQSLLKPLMVSVPDKEEANG